jgi:hypothetical protein
MCAMKAGRRGAVANFETTAPLGRAQPVRPVSIQSKVTSFVSAL